MRANEIIVEYIVDEMALSKYQTLGNFDKPGSFREKDKKIVTHPKNQIKATKFFKNTVYDFRLFFANIPGASKYSEVGEVSPEKLKHMFGPDIANQILEGHEDAISVVYVNNRGDAKIMLTPWMMAHRFGHSMQATSITKYGSTDAWKEAQKHFFGSINTMLEEFYGKASPSNHVRDSMKWDMTPEYNALFNAIGIQRSSRTGQIRRPYEFLYECFAQYLGTGEVKFNPLPVTLGYGRQAWGRPTRYMNIKPEYNDEADRAAKADLLGRDMEIMFDSVVSSAVGKIFVM